MLKILEKLNVVPVIKQIFQVKATPQVPAQNQPRVRSAIMANTKPIVWIDMEMTGLNVEKDRIIEIACLITDHQLNTIAEGPNVVIHQPDTLLLSMDDWCTKTHTATGLFKACQESTVSEAQAEEQVLTFIQQYTKKSESPLAGNTIYMDRYFLIAQMPKIHNYLSYRIVDVSSIKECCHRWHPEIFAKA